MFSPTSTPNNSPVHPRDRGDFSNWFLVDAPSASELEAQTPIFHIGFDTSMPQSRSPTAAAETASSSTPNPATSSAEATQSTGQDGLGERCRRQVERRVRAREERARRNEARRRHLADLDHVNVLGELQELSDMADTAFLCVYVGAGIGLVSWAVYKLAKAFMVDK